MGSAIAQCRTTNSESHPVDERQSRTALESSSSESSYCGSTKHLTLDHVIPRSKGGTRVEPGHASFLLPADLPELEELEAALQREYNPNATILLVDDASVEVNLSGCWVAESKEAQEGMFLTVMSNSLSPFRAATPTETLRERIERFIYKLWQMSEVYISSLA